MPSISHRVVQLPFQLAFEWIVEAEKEDKVAPAQLCRQCLYNLRLGKKLREPDHIEEVSPAESLAKLLGQSEQKSG